RTAESRKATIRPKGSRTSISIFSSIMSRGLNGRHPEAPARRNRLSSRTIFQARASKDDRPRPSPFEGRLRRPPQGDGTGDTARNNNMLDKLHGSRIASADRYDWDELVQEDRAPREIYTDPAIFEAEMVN